MIYLLAIAVLVLGVAMARGGDVEATIDTSVKLHPCCKCGASGECSCFTPRPDHKCDPANWTCATCGKCTCYNCVPGGSFPTCNA